MNLKTQAEIAIMAEGGKKLSVVKNELKKAVKAGVSAREIDDLAEKLIKKEGSEPSFKTVPKYSWATCINVNSGVVHGIPHKHIIFKRGDVVSVDVGLYYKGFHTDTSFSVLVGNDKKRKNFLKAGKEALNFAIKQAKTGNRIYDISEAIESTLLRHKLNPVRALVGHGIGKDLHEDPYIPCFVTGTRGESLEIKKGLVLAIEVMYSEGSGDVVQEDDGWTIGTTDGKIAGLFEETVAVSEKVAVVLTE